MRKIIAILLTLFSLLPARAQEAATSVTPASSSGEEFISAKWALIVVAGILLLIIVALYQVLQTAMQLYADKHYNQKSGQKMISTILLCIAIGIPAVSNAQEVVKDTNDMSTSPNVFYVVTFLVIVLELFFIFYLLRLIRYYMGLEPVIADRTAPQESIWQKVWQKMNQFQPLEREVDMDTGHNYDGIRELDNITPPWFTAGFVFTILFSIVYLWRYHVAESAPLQAEEYKIAMQDAEVELQAYLKVAGNKVDETNVKELTGTDLDAGAKVYQQHCVACHGPQGQGGVGPNFADTYWIHGGGIKDIFKTIKYGVVEKGMKSWKEDLSARQMAQVASFIRTFKGTHPPNPKEPQGNIYTEAATDSVTIAATDTTAQKMK